MEQNLLTDIVKSFFETNQWKYQEQDGVFESGTPLDAPIESALIHMIADDSALAVLTALDYTIPEDCTATMLEFCNLANMLLPAGCFYLDRAEQMLVFRLTEFVMNHLMPPSVDDVEDQLLYCLTNLQQAARVLPQLVDGTLSVEEAVETVTMPPFDAQNDI